MQSRPRPSNRSRIAAQESRTLRTLLVGHTKLEVESRCSSRMHHAVLTDVPTSLAPQDNVAPLLLRFARCRPVRESLCRRLEPAAGMAVVDLPLRWMPALTES